MDQHNEPTGTIVFSTVGRVYYGFDLFSLNMQNHQERRLTDGISINFNAQFINDDLQSIVFVSERTGSARVYITRPDDPNPHPQPLPSVPNSLFHDRPILRNNTLFFVSAHEFPNQQLKSWSAVYSIALKEDNEITRLTPRGAVDYSPAISRSGELVAVASYGTRPWAGEFRALDTDIVVFPIDSLEKRTVVAQRGGWPSWFGDDVIYFHRQSEDGWWSIYRTELRCSTEDEPVRITPAGVHCFTPAAMQDGRRIAVATRRRGRSHRHVEIFDTVLKTFDSLTELINPNLHHYNPFVSPDSKFIGYHRFRGESTQSESTIPHLKSVASPINGLRMLRLNGNFASFSPNGAFIAFNLDFQSDGHGGVKVIKSDGSKRWTLIKGRTAFYNCWSRTEENVIYTSLGPIFESAKATVQIARIAFNINDLNGEKDEVTSDVKILTAESTGNNAFSSCSSNGKWLVFRSGRNGYKNLYVIDAVNGESNGEGVRQLTDGPWIDTMPSWSPNGDLIAFSSNRHSPNNPEVFSIYLIKPDGSELRRVHLAGSELDKERINHVCFSPDGEWLLFTANLGGVTAEPVSWPNQFQPYGELYLARLDGSGLRRLTWNGFENGTPAWHCGDDLDLGRLCLGAEAGDKLKGEFDEPLWISCDI